MATAFAIQPSFGRGELSPRLHARVDIDHWRIGLAECFNFVVLRQGGLRRRPGTQFVALTKEQTESAITRSVPFVFSAEQSYVLELGDEYMRVLGLGGQVMDGGDPYEVETPWASEDVTALQFAQSGDVLYVVHRDYAPHKITRKAEADWTIEPVDFEDGPFLEINTEGVTLTPSGTGDLVPLMTGDTAPSGTASASSNLGLILPYMAFDRDRDTEWSAGVEGAAWLQYQFPAPQVVTGYAIRAGRLVYAYPDSSGSTGGSPTITIYKIPGGLRAPRTWAVKGSNDGTTWTTLHTQAGVTGWGDGERRYFTFENKIAYSYYRLDIVNSNQSDRPVTLAEWSLQGAEANVQTVTLTASGTDGINDDQGFVSSDVGRHLRLLSEDAYWHWFKITDVTSSTVVQAQLRSPPLPSVDRINSWRFGAFSATTGYPKAISFFLERLVYGSTREQPQTVWGSRTGDFDDFSTSTPLKPDDAFTFTLGEVGEIEWLAESAELVIGTVSAVRALGAANKNEGFSATNVAQGKPARSGVAPIQPVLAGETPIFVARFGKAIREASYSFDAQGYTAPDISVLSEHLFADGVTAIAFAQNPNALIWAARSDGDLVGITYEREQQMVAIHRHALGGAGFVESLCVIPGETRHELWLIVRREREDGTFLRTHERLAADFENQDQVEAYYLDCGLTYDDVPTVTITGLDHLDDFDVGVMADGSTEPETTVELGALTLPSGQEAMTIHAGFSYESRAKTLPVAQGFGDGSGLGRRKRVKKIIANLMETGQLQAKATSRSYQDLVLRSASDFMDSPPALITGDVETHVDDRWGGRGIVEIRSVGPQPATVRALTLAFDGEP